VLEVLAARNQSAVKKRYERGFLFMLASPAVQASGFLLRMPHTLRALRTPGRHSRESRNPFFECITAKRCRLCGNGGSTKTRRKTKTGVTAEKETACQ